MIKLLIFDFDGTIVKSKSLYLNTIYHTLKKNNYNISKGAVKNLLGLRSEILLPKLGITNPKKIKALRKEINNKVLKKSTNLIACPKIKSLNSILQKNKCVLVTNSLSKYTLPFLKRHNLKFLIILGSKQFSSKQDAFKKLFKKFNVKPREAIYIADKVQDVDISREVGCKSAVISNRYSWSSLAEIKIKKPDYILKNLREIRKLPLS